MLKMKVVQQGAAPLMQPAVTPTGPQAPGLPKQQQPRQMLQGAPQNVHPNPKTGRQLPAAWQMHQPLQNAQGSQGFSPPRPSGVLGQDAVISTRS